MAETIDLFTVPRPTEFKHFRWQTIQIAGQEYQLRSPMVTATDLSRVLETLARNQERYLQSRPLVEIIDWIDQAVQRWTKPDYPLRQLALRLLPALTGYNSETIMLELKRFIRTFRKKELLRFVEMELNPPTLLDDFQPQCNGGQSQAVGPGTIFHVFSGNIPGLAVWPLVMGLLVKAANLGKTSGAEPLFSVLFTRSLAEINADLASCLAILPWKGGDRKLELTAASQTGATIVYGTDSTVDHFRPLVPMGHPFLHYGYKISFSMIGREALTPNHYLRTIDRAVEDVAVYDQQSCLSSQMIFVERGGAVSPKQVARLIANALANYQVKRPRSALAGAEAAAINRVRSDYQFAALAGEAVDVMASPGSTNWTVVYHAKPGFSASPLNRFIHVFQVERLEDVGQALPKEKAHLQSCGMAVAPWRVAPLAKQLGNLGVSRFCALGEMTRVPAGWHHDGHFNLLDLLTFVDIEPSIERLAEQFDPDVE